MNAFENYINLCRKVAWKYSIKYRIEYDDVEAESYLIYCECIEKYDPMKSSFSTYLFTALNGYLSLYCKKQVREIDGLTDNERLYDVEDLSLDVSMSELLESARNVLSNTAYRLVSYILSHEWDGGWYKHFTKNVGKRFLGFGGKKFDDVWNECSSWWNDEGIKLYA